MSNYSPRDLRFGTPALPRCRTSIDAQSLAGYKRSLVAHVILNGECDVLRRAPPFHRNLCEVFVFHLLWVKINRDKVDFEQRENQEVGADIKRTFDLERCLFAALVGFAANGMTWDPLYFPITRIIFFFLLGLGVVVGLGGDRREAQINKGAS